MHLEVLSHTEGARPGRPPLLFVHGGFHAAWCWDVHYLPFFAERGWAAHALSLRGHGASDGQAELGEWSLDDYVEDVLSTLERFDTPAILLGHSMGGVVAERCWSRDAERVAGLALLAGSPLRPALSVVLRMFQRSPVDLVLGGLQGDPLRMRNAMAPFLLSDDLTAADRAATLDRLDLESPVAMRELFRRKPIARADGDDRPVLVVAATDDRSIPVAAHEATCRRLDGTLLRVAGPHDLMLDPGWKPGADAIEDWLRTRFPSVAAGGGDLDSAPPRLGD